jgi:starch-binding outer membrane protein, SusD/RagB family
MNYQNLIKRFVPLSFMLLAACTDLVNEEVDSTVVSAGGGAAGNPTELLAAAYKDLGAYTDQANIYALTEHTTDEMIPPTRGVDWGDNGVWRTLHAHNWDPTHSMVLTAWNQLNERVYKATQLLSFSPTPAQAAEAKFLRAFNMFWVMDFYGQVPFRELSEGVNDNPKVKTRSEAFDFIVKDLTEALPGLAAGAIGFKNGKATQAAANALLARLYLNKGVYKAADPTGPYTFDKADMDKVITYAQAVTAAGFTLEDNYFNAFSKDGATEKIFTINNDAGTPQNRWFMTLHYDQKPSGWNGFTTLADFYNKVEAGDQRKGAPSPADLNKDFHGIPLGFLIGQQINDAGTNMTDSRTQKLLKFTEDVPLAGAATDKGIRVIKYHPANSGDYILLRYADVYLMEAEAKLRGGTGSGPSAQDMVNALRAKRGASNITLDLPKMLDERGRELYWEGVRRTDQIRFETFDDTWSEKSVTEKTRVLYCIPQQALDSNPNLVQNAGY